MHCVATYSPPVTNVTLGRKLAMIQSTGRSGDRRPLNAASARSGQLHSSPRKAEARAQQQNSLLEARWNVVVGGNLAMGSCRTRQAAGGGGRAIIGRALPGPSYLYYLFVLVLGTWTGQRFATKITWLGGTTRSTGIHGRRSRGSVRNLGLSASC